MNGNWPLARVPCTIVTGFLGAGKTTLIRHVLANAQGRRLAVIVNEFGDVGIDGEILKGCGNAACPEENIVELANGCLCCTVADEFVPALDAILAKGGIEHIVIETSGLALPKPLVQAFHWPAIKSRVTVDGVVVVVDGAALADGRVAQDLDALARQRAADTALDHDDPVEEVFEDQIACADLVVLNKRDLLDDAGVNRRWRRSSSALPRSVKVAHRHRRQGRCRRCCSGLASAPKTTSPTAAPSTTPKRSTITTISIPSSCRSARSPIRRRWPRASPRLPKHFDVLRVKGFAAVDRQAAALAGASGRTAGDASIRPALDRVRGARRPARRDRTEGPGSRRGHAGA